MKNLIKEYYSALIAKAENYSGEVPYSPEEELSKIKEKIKLQKQRRIRTITAVAASVVCVAIGVSMAVPTDNEPVKKDGLLLVDNEASGNESMLETAELPVVGTLEDAAIDTRVTQAPETEVKKGTMPMYTHVPQITMPPMERIEYEEYVEYAVKDIQYVLETTAAPQLDINENENVTSGSAMYASHGEAGENSGDLWSEEEYFSYLGKNILDGLEVPADLAKSKSEEKYMLRDENGSFVNDNRTFSYANSDRTRLLNITTSKSPISDVEYDSTDINGVKVSIFDNHMSNTTFLAGNGIYVSAEMYGLNKEELMSIVYSLAERMAL